MKRLRQRAVYERIQAAWARSGYGPEVPHREPPRTPPRTPPTHRQNVTDREAEKETGRGR